jgi:hypothetical protein
VNCGEASLVADAKVLSSKGMLSDLGGREQQDGFAW